MPYVYAERRAFVFTEEGQKTFLAVRDKAKRLLETAGAFNQEKVLKGISGGSG